MRKPKVLLHLGLPKTATSSLQHNVLQVLHKEGKINFLGKCLDYDLRTRELEIYNYSGKFIRDAAEEKLSVEEAQARLIEVVDQDKLNVFSDEGLMIAYPGKENLPLVRKFQNIAEIFRNYDLKVVVTLRDSVSYLYSLYVELYPDYCSSVRAVKTIKKYTTKLINDPEDILFESLAYDKWVGDLEDKFQTTILSYEKLAKGDKETFTSWADLLGITENEFSGLFNSRKVNVKSKSGKEVQKVKDYKGLETGLRAIVARDTFAFKLARCLYNKTGLKKILNRRVVSKKTHVYPSGSHLDRLRATLGPRTTRNESL